MWMYGPDYADDDDVFDEEEEEEDYFDLPPITTAISMPSTPETGDADGKKHQRLDITITMRKVEVNNMTLCRNIRQ